MLTIWRGVGRGGAGGAGGAGGGRGGAGGAGGGRGGGRGGRGGERGGVPPQKMCFVCTQPMRRSRDGVPKVG